MDSPGLWSLVKPRVWPVVVLWFSLQKIAATARNFVILDKTHARIFPNFDTLEAWILNSCSVAPILCFLACPCFWQAIPISSVQDCWQAVAELRCDDLVFGKMLEDPMWRALCCRCRAKVQSHAVTQSNVGQTERKWTVFIEFKFMLRRCYKKFACCVVNAAAVKIPF